MFPTSVSLRTLGVSEGIHSTSGLGQEVAFERYTGEYKCDFRGTSLDLFTKLTEASPGDRHAVFSSTRGFDLRLGRWGRLGEPAWEDGRPAEASGRQRRPGAQGESLGEISLPRRGSFHVFPPHLQPNKPSRRNTCKRAALQRSPAP